MNDRCFTAIVSLLCFVLLCPDVAYSQKKPKGNKGGGGGGGQNKNADNEVSIEGHVKQVTPQGLIVDDEEGTRYLIGFGAGSQVTLQGTAGKGFFVPGAYLEFEADLDRAGKSATEVREITFVDPSNLNPAGLFPTEIPVQKTSRDKDATSAFLVRGKMLPPKDGLMVVQTGQKLVTTKIDPDAKLSVRFSNWSLAAVGDSVSGKADVVSQVKQGLTPALGKKITIKAAETLQPPKSKREELKAKSE